MDRLRRQRLLAAWSGALLCSLGLTACEGSNAPEPTIERCVDAETEFLNGQPTGFELCGTGRNRASQEVCPDLRETNNSTVNNSTNGTTDGSTNNANSGCERDSDCSEERYGHCGWVAMGTSGVLEQDCVPGCRQDSDCGDGFICECRDPVGRCIPSTCRDDAECGSDLKCARYIRDPGCDSLAYACQTAEDECDPAIADACPEGEVCTADYFNTGRRLCAPPGCTAGRPFIVEGFERVAPLAERNDWLATLADIDVSMSPAIREALRDHWADIGLMEHASVAAFARFALHLMQLGAPPKLLFDTQTAMKDETEHALMCFALASNYGGAEVGPGPLDLDGAFEETTLIDILNLVIEEGCIGETTAALEAAESAELAQDPVVAEVLRRIAEDEQRHAELAWATLQWVLQTQGRDVRAALKAAFERAIDHAASRPASEENPDEATLLRHGVFSDRLRDGVRRDVIARVVAPTFAALWASVDRESAAAT